MKQKLDKKYIEGFFRMLDSEIDSDIEQLQIIKTRRSSLLKIYDFKFQKS